jgi:predicted transcriptional regulator
MSATPKAASRKTRPTPEKTALEIIKRLPDDVTYEAIMYEIYVRERIERGIQQLDNGQSVPHEEVVRDVAKWRESAGF